MIIDSTIGQYKTELDTPCLVIDKHILQNNIQNMQFAAQRAKKLLRPHAKTHKCLEICRLQIAAGAIGIAVAKVSEALVLAEHDFKNTLITSPIVTETKIAALMLCLQRDPNLIVVIDNLENAQALNEAARNHSCILNILIDLDPHIGRTGIAFSAIKKFANALQNFPNLELKGLQCYAGNLQHITDYGQRMDAVKKVTLQIEAAVQALREEGLPCEIVSGSGTGTYDIDLQLSSMTEIQPGSYTVMDAEYYSIGSVDDPQHIIKFKPALTLLTTVISVDHPNSVTCDAGWKALYVSPTRPLVLHPAGYAYDWFGDEHGKITAVQSGTTLPQLGDRLELMVAHSDPTINMYDTLHVIDQDLVVDNWPVTMRGKSQ